MTSRGATIDKDTPVESVRRDADLYYPLHHRDYFPKLEFAGIADFEGRRCYWLHGTTHWGKDNNQFYDVETGLLAGYRFQSDSSSSAKTITALFQEYRASVVRWWPPKPLCAPPMARSPSPSKR